MTDEAETETSPRAGRSLSIVVWWKKFHFSGRVIMCSVLFGLGLVLIGSLIFAINIDDDSSSNSEKSSEQLPTKPPSKYVGPAIMGIGGFIVVVGIIMCLFETQVCRKKSSDASPLIREETDPEGKGSDSIPVPNSSHSHKHHKHKRSTSPRKSKSKHGKSSSKEKSKDNSLSPRTPPVSIDKSKSFMTSSEDTFLTPPNAPDSALTLNNSNNVENGVSSSVMKSFTSSGPSWNQSTEFLTPSTSFKDASISLTDSVEVDEKQEHVNYKNSEEYNAEYMTPLTVEEDRIQKLLVRVRNEQAEVAKKEMEETSEITPDVKSENDIIDSSSIQNKAIKEGTKMGENTENKNISTDGLAPGHLADISQTQTANFKNSSELNEPKNNHEKNDFSDRCAVREVHDKSPVGNKGVEKEISHIDKDISEKRIATKQVDEKQKTSSVSESSVSLLREDKQDLNEHFNRNLTSDETNENELENSVSSDETVVSPGSFVEKSKNTENTESALLENSNPDKQYETENVLESLNDAKSVDDNSNSDSTNVSSSVKERADSDEVNHREIDVNVDSDSEISPAVDSG